MKNVKKYNEFNKVNEELQIFGMDVVITLTELLQGTTIILLLSIIGATLGFYKLRSFILHIINDREKVRALKRLSHLIEKYKDDVVVEYLNKIKYNIKNKYSGQNRNTGARARGLNDADAKGLSNYLRDKMSKDDITQYDEIINDIYTWIDSYKINR